MLNYDKKAAYNIYSQIVTLVAFFGVVSIDVPYLLDATSQIFSTVSKKYRYLSFVTRYQSFSLTFFAHEMPPFVHCIRFCCWFVFRNGSFWSILSLTPTSVILLRTFLELAKTFNALSSLQIAAYNIHLSLNQICSILLP